MRAAALLLSAGAMAGCTEVQTAVDSTARQGTKSVVAEVLATRFSQVPQQLITPFTDCIIDNATADEVQEYVKAAVRGVDDGTVAAVHSALSRRETVTCLGGNASALV
ncbi:MAG: hypothetical protein AAF744_16195 [Pseudomonadota bacterium]